MSSRTPWPDTCFSGTGNPNDPERFHIAELRTGALVGLEAIPSLRRRREVLGRHRERVTVPSRVAGRSSRTASKTLIVSQKTLSALVAFYDAARCKPNASELLENEAEFTQYWLVYFLDQEEGSEEHPRIASRSNGPSCT